MDVAKSVVEITGSKSHIANPQSDPHFVDIYRTKLDKAREELSYRPVVSMKEGLRAYIKLVKDGKSFPGTTPAFYRDAVSQSLMLRLYQVPLDVHKLVPRNPKILIIGAGVCGICAALRLQELGHTNYEILEAESYHNGLASSYVDRKVCACVCMFAKKR